MEPNYTGGRRQRTPEEIIKLLEEFDKSEGITVKEYCAMIGVSDAAFYNWRKQYGAKSDAEQEETAGFIELVPSENGTSAQGLFAEVKVIKFYQPLSKELLKSLAL
jgi:hypothetical protein